MDRREFLQVLAAGAAAGFPVASRDVLAQGRAGAAMYDVPAFGNVSLLHFTDCHGQLVPGLYREPSVNLGFGAAEGQPPHLVGEALLKRFGIKPGTIDAHAFTYLDFTAAARTYGKVGGFAHLATLVKRLKASRPGALLLDGGDTWQGSATALWTKGQDMVDACKLLGVDVMTGHWDFTLGTDRVKEIVTRELAGKIEFLAQNVQHRRLRRSRVSRVHDALRQRRAGRDHRAGVSVHADREPALFRRRLDLRHPGGEPPEDRRRGAQQGRAGRCPAVAQRHGPRSQARVARARHRRDPRRPHARRRAGAVDRRQRRRPHARDQRRQQRQVPRGARSRRQGRQGRRLSLQAVAGVLEPAARGRRNGGAHRQGPLAVQGEARRSGSPSPRGSSIAAATSTARSTSCCSTA